MPDGFDLFGGGMPLAQEPLAEPLPVRGRPAPTPPQDQKAGLKQLAPLLALIPLAMKKGGPQGVAALLQGYQQRQAEKRQQAQQGYQNERQAWTDQSNMDYRNASLEQQQSNQQATRENQRLTQLQAFRKQVSDTLPTLDSAEAVQAYLQFIEPQARALGINPQEVSNFALQMVTPSALETRKAMAELKTLKSTYSPEILDRMERNGAVTDSGKTIPQLRLAAGAGLKDRSGAPMAVPPEEPKPSTEVSWQRDEMVVNGRRVPVFINPKTRQILDQAGNDVTTSAQVVPPAERAQQTVLIQTIDANGNPVTKIVPKVAGTELPTAPNATQQNAVSEQQAGLDMIGDISAQFKPEFVGPIAGREWKAKMVIPGVEIPQEVASFHAAVAGLRNEIIRLMSGAAVSGQEQQRLNEQIPDVTNKPAVFLARLEQTKRNREMLLQRMQKRGATSPNAPPTGQKLKVGRFEVEVAP